MTDDTEQPRHAAVDERRRSFFRRHVVLTSFLSVVLVMILAGAGFALWLNSSLGDIERIPLTIAEDTRPAPSTTEALNILLLGTDAGSERNKDGRDILADAASGKWPAGKYRSDATMLVHIPADRESAVVVSIPRDSFVPIHDETGTEMGSSKINSALSIHGPSGAISTVENFTGLRVDHVAMVDWDGFRAITDALGGVRMTTDEGTRIYDGQEALAYVRDRFNVEGGDFGRVRRHQNFLRAVMEEALNRDTLTNPVSLTKTIRATTSNLAIDEGWSNGDIRGLAISMRNLRANDVTFMTIPTLGTDMHPVAGSIVVVDDTECARLFDAIANGDLADFLRDHKELKLQEAERVD